MTTSLPVLVEVEGGRAVGQHGSTLFVLSECCRKPYRFSPATDEDEAQNVCVGCHTRMSVLPCAELTGGAFWNTQFLLDVNALGITHHNEEQLRKWVAAWLGAEVEAVELVQTT